MKISSLNFVFISIVFFSIISCQTDNKSGQHTTNTPKSEKETKRLLRASTGQISSVYLYLDSTYEDSVIKDTLLYHLDQPYLLTPTPSSAIDITRYNFDYYRSGKVGTANNLIVANVKEETKIAQYVKRVLGQQKIDALLKEKDFALIKTTDTNATPQQTFFLLIDGFPSLVSDKNRKLLDSYAKTIVDDVTELDNKRIISSFVQKRNLLAEKQIKKDFAISMWVPKSYTLIDEKKNFVWLLNETRELYSNIVIYKEPRKLDVSLEKQAILMRDSFGKFITTYKEGSRMTTNVKFKPFPIQREILINNKKVLETRGLWSMQNDKLGGGFVNYTFENENGEAVAIDGFVYYSGDKKRKKLRDIDAILSTVQLN